MSTPREILLLAASNNDSKDLLKILQQQNTNKPAIDMAEIISELSQRQSKVFCESVTDTVKNVLSANLQCMDSFKENVEPLKITKEESIQVLLGVTSVINTLLHTEKFDSENILSICMVLHDAIKLLPQEPRCNILRNRVSQMCELWWSNGLPFREKIIQNSFVFLLKKSLVNGAKSDVKRLNSIKDCLTIIYLIEEENTILTKCASSSLFLETKAGLSFVSFALTLSSKNMKLIHLAIKKKLTCCQRKVAASYGEIYIKAWNCLCENALKEQLELCIQELMELCIQTASHKFFTSLKILLNYLNGHQLHDDFRQMIARLYEPILWRSLKMANSTVRRNATTLFFGAFPLYSPNLGQVEKDNEIQKQLSLARTLMFDPCSSVRSTALLGICSIFSQFWSLIPINVINEMLMDMVEDLAVDISSWNIRVNVFKGLAILLRNPLSFEVLKRILPHLAWCIHDRVENVRVAFLECLLLLKPTKSIKFWDVVHPNELLYRLATDPKSVGFRITKLLLPTYLPVNKDDLRLIDRSIMLITANRAASLNFYKHAFTCKNLDLENAVRFILICHRLLFEYVKTELKKAAANCSDEIYIDPTEESDSDDAEQAFDNLDLDMEVIGGLLDAISVIWISVNCELTKDRNKPLLKKLNLRLSKPMHRFFKVFRETEVFESLLKLSSLLPAPNVQMANSYCLSRLRSLPSSSVSEDYALLLENMFNWSRVDDVIDVICVWLHDGLSTTPTPKRVKNKKNVKFQEPRAAQPQLALDLIAHMLKKSSCSKMLLTKYRHCLQDLFNHLKKVQTIVDDYYNSKVDLNPSATDDFIVDAFSSMYAIAIALGDNDGQTHIDGTALFSEILNWVEMSVLPKLIVHAQVMADSSLDTKDISFSKKRSMKLMKEKEKLSLLGRIILISISASSDLLVVAKVDIDLAAQISNFCGLLLNGDASCQANEGCEMLKQLLCAIFLLDECSSTKNGSSHLISQATVPRLLSAWLKSLSLFIDHYEDQTDQLLTDVKPPLTNLLLNYRRISLQRLNTTMATFMAAVLSNVTNFIKNEKVSIKEDVNLNSLPRFAVFLLSVIIKETVLTRCFIKELKNCLKTYIIKDCFGLSASFAIFSVIKKTGKVPFTEIKEGVLALEDAVHESCKAPAFHDNEDEERIKLKFKEVQYSLQCLKKQANIAS